MSGIKDFSWKICDREPVRDCTVYTAVREVVCVCLALNCTTELVAPLFGLACCGDECDGGRDEQ